MENHQLQREGALGNLEVAEEIGSQVAEGDGNQKEEVAGNLEAEEDRIGEGTGLRMQYRIIKATFEDRDKVLDFLRQNFYNEEPINAAMNNESDTLSKADEEHTLELLQEEMSLLAVNNEGHIIGLCLSGSVTSQEAIDMEKLSETCGCERFSKLLQFLAYVERESNIWNQCGVTSGLSVQALAVTQAARGHGVGRALLEKNRELAKTEGYSLFRVDCSSYFSARLAEEIGMKCVFSLPFSQYKDKDGCPVFKVKSPNDDMKVYIQKLA